MIMTRQGVSGHAVRLEPYTSYQADPAALKRGMNLYKANCGGYCHAAYAASGSDAPYLLDCDWLHGGEPQDIFYTIAHGVEGTRMEPFMKLLPDRENDIWRIVAYLKKASTCTDDQHED